MYFEYISFCTDDMLDDKLLTPLKNGHLMIRPRIKDAAKELCEQLAEIYMAKNDEKKLEIAVQIKRLLPNPARADFPAAFFVLRKRRSFDAHRTERIRSQHFLSPRS